MKTLTLTEAKKNLGKWLNAAVQGEEISIINGAICVALRPVEIEATDYAWREYGVNKDELASSKSGSRRRSHVCARRAV